MIYDLAIIGGGPAGYTAAERAGAKGLKTILFERNALGGVCLNEGCIPTKTLLYSAKTLASIRSAAKYGIHVSGEASADLAKIIARKNKVVRKLVAGIKQKLNAHETVIVNGNAEIKGENENKHILISCEGETYEVKKLLLCTGSETIIPPIKGLDSVSYWTSREALDCKELPESLAIIGGGVIGMEFAYFYHTLGVKVSVIEMLPEILANMDKESAEMLRAEYTKAGIAFYLDTKVQEVTAEKVVAEKDGERIEIEARQLLLSTGRRPVIAGLGLEKLNIELHGRGVKVDEHMHTSHPSVYACGDVTGYSLLAHTAVREAEVAVNHLTGTSDQMSYNAIPGVVYTNPEIAGVGALEGEIEGSKIVKLPMAYSGRFVAENELGNGFCKLILSKDDIIIGCHMLGNPSSELIVIAGIAIEKGYTVDQFQKIVFPHPTVGEILHESLFAE
ncbi:dihydrolipoyl dehydrogenase [Dysgonomonas sp. 25]|uniref:dihydrolipoyl dehydrogenase n=1 Tax=Dysgonomonas sp. 25 TaxID=2302933 RepID=UPI0013D83CD2|nr:dihydrolipoyl dehydrogenase [Dysgonomonas sp. 25]NDV68986.1 dihydrolipoyl dehydrogenase [Dysgonomonas sp. 25]